MRKRYVMGAILAALALLFVGFSVGLVVGTSIPRNLGGIDVQAACTQQFPGTKAVVAKHNVYGWRCTSPGQSHGVNLNKQCVVQYGSDAVASYSNFNDPLSWQCRRKPESPLTENGES